MTETSTPLKAFKAYDVRGQVPADLNEQLVYTIGTQVVPMVGAKTVVVGHDARLESPTLMAALAAGLQAAGAEVLTIGMCGTEEVYCATATFGYPLGIMVTASHNPKGYNGLKMILADGVAFDSAMLKQLEALTRAALPGAPASVPAPAPLKVLEDAREAYLDRVMGFVAGTMLKPMKIVVNGMNGSAGPTLHALAERLPQMEWIWMQDAPDGNFPHGLPNPLLPEQRARTSEAVREHNADLGVAFDGDFDRCFVFGPEGDFVAPYYTLGLLTEAMLEAHPGAAIVHDPRLYWDTVATIEAHGGKPVMSKGGHLFFKQKLREEGAVFGAEATGHYFFSDFFCCDSGVIPLLLVLKVLSEQGRTLSELVEARKAETPVADETNFRLSIPTAEMVAKLEQAHSSAKMERLDGTSFDFGTWRFNARGSNTEPLLRLNVEARDAATLSAKHAELVAFIENAGGKLADH